MRSSKLWSTPLLSRTTRSVAACWLVLVAPACSRKQLPPAPAQVVLVPGPAAVEPCSPLIGVLAGVGMVVLLPRERQEQELEQLVSLVDRTDLLTDRLRLALLLTLGDEAIRDTERARELIEGRTWDDTAYEAIARLALELLDERKDRARDRLDLSYALEQERREKAELEARLAEIRAIETEMDARELAAPEVGAETPYPVR